MTRDEVMVFKNYDSIGLMPKNGVGMHSSFHDPATPAEAPPREVTSYQIILDITLRFTSNFIIFGFSALLIVYRSACCMFLVCQVISKFPT